MFRRLLSGLLLATLLRHGHRLRLSRLGHAELHGKLVEPGELSGAVLHGNLLLVCADERPARRPARRSPNRYEALTPLRLLEDEQAEIDLEGLASDGRHVYVVGPHPGPQKKIDNSIAAGQPAAAGRSQPRLESLPPVPPGHRSGWCLPAEGVAVAARDLRAHPLLGPFTKIPGKENGVDVEGLAVRDGNLYVGFRGPFSAGTTCR